MARKTGVSGIFSMSGFEKPVVQPKKARNLHTEEYDDDGSVITISLEKFFSGFSEYSKFLNDGSRSYMSLTDKEGQEIFQFSMVGAFKGASQHKIKRQVIIDGKQKRKNVEIVMGALSKRYDSPIVMQTAFGHVYGILHPMVKLDKE